MQIIKRKHIGILTIEKGIPKWSILTKQQFKALTGFLKNFKSGQLNALAKESKDVYDMVFN